MIRVRSASPAFDAAHPELQKEPGALAGESDEPRELIHSSKREDHR